MNTRAYSNYAGQQFVRTSDTHGLAGGKFPIEFETEIELDVWLAQRLLVETDMEPRHE